MLAKLQAAWRKNSPEVLGFVNGALPSFVRRGGRGGELEGVPVFSYHVVEATAFGADLQFLARNHYRCLTLDELLDRVAGRVPGTGREVALTFDDGPRNFFDVAFPLLQQFGMQGTVFVAPGLHAENYAELDSLEFRPMTWGEIRTLHSSGLVSVQSHTLQSQYVPQWPAAAALAGVDPRIEARLRRPALPMKEDFIAARERIAAHCPGASVRHLCYPMYRTTAAGLEAAKEAGYAAGYGGLLPGQPTVSAGADASLLPRMSWEFLRRLPGDGRVTLTQLAMVRMQDAGRARARQRQFPGAT